MKKILCKIFGHVFLYNFSRMPNKRICKRCHKKEMWTKIAFVWDATFKEERSDEELIKKWHKIK
jgi:hypothetical protein